MVGKFLHSKTKTITFTAYLLAGFYLFSRVFGLLRNNLLGHLFPKEQADIYLAAFRVPDFVYGVLITGGIAAAFLPVFSRYFKKDKQEAKELVNNVLTVFLLAMVVVSSILAIFAPQLAKVIVPGFSVADQILTASLMRIMFIASILLGLSAIFSGILHYFRLFFAYGLAPIFYNIGIIIGMIFLTPYFGLKGLAYGVILGALMHLLIQILPTLKYGFYPRFSFNLKHSGLLKIFRLMLPRTIGSAAYHFNLIIITAIASTLPAGSIRVFSFANDLYGVPIALIGVSFATAVFPVLSRNFATSDKVRFSKNFSNTFSQIIFASVPLTFLMFIFRAQIVRLLYGTKLLGNGFFGWQDTRLIAASVGIFAFSIIAASLIPFLAKTFFALHNTKTPVKIAIVSVLVNIGVAFLFVWLFAFDNILSNTLIKFLKVQDVGGVSVLALPLAVLISSSLQVILLVIFLKKQVSSLRPKTAKFFKVLLASTFMAFCGWLSLQALAVILNTSTVVGILLQLGLASIISIIIYLILTYLLKLQELNLIWQSVTTQFKKST